MTADRHFFVIIIAAAASLDINTPRYQCLCIHDKDQGIAGTLRYSKKPPTFFFSTIIFASKPVSLPFATSFFAFYSWGENATPKRLATVFTLASRLPETGGVLLCACCGLLFLRLPWLLPLRILLWCHLLCGRLDARRRWRLLRCSHPDQVNGATLPGLVHHRQRERRLLP